MEAQWEEFLSRTEVVVHPQVPIPRCATLCLTMTCCATLRLAVPHFASLPHCLTAPRETSLRLTMSRCSGAPAGTSASVCPTVCDSRLAVCDSLRLAICRRAAAGRNGSSYTLIMSSWELSTGAGRCSGDTLRKWSPRCRVLTSSPRLAPTLTSLRLTVCLALLAASRTTQY